MEIVGFESVVVGRFYLNQHRRHLAVVLQFVAPENSITKVSNSYAIGLAMTNNHRLIVPQHLINRPLIAFSPRN